MVKDMGDIPVTPVEVLKCRYCGLMVTSLKRFRLHVEECRMLCVNSHDGDSTTIFSSQQCLGFGDPREMERVVLPLPKIRLMRRSSADIKKIKSAGSASADLNFNRQKRHQLNQAGMRALSNIREVTSQIVETTYYDLDEDNLKCSPDEMDTSQGFERPPVPQLAKNKNCNPVEVNPEYMAVTLEPLVEVVKCRQCGILVTSMKRFQSHLGNCRMMQQSHNSLDPVKMERVVLPLPNIRLSRLRSADIGQFKYSDEATTPFERKTPRHASLKALSNIRNAASRIVKTANCSPDEIDSNYSSDDMDNLQEPSPVKKRPRKRTSSRPVFGNQKRKSGAHLANRSRTTSDEIYSINCQQCTAFFDSQSSLEKHIRNVHEDQHHHLDVHACPICDRMIWRRLCLQGHLKSHMDAEEIEETHQLWERWPDKKDGRFPCKHCLMLHSTHHSYLTHMKAKHPDIGRGFKWTCKYCSKEDFGSLKLLVSHLKDCHHKEYYGDTLKWVDGNPKQKKRPKKACDICGEMIDIYHMKTHKIEEHSVGGTSQRKFKKTPEQNKYQCPLKDCGTKLKTVPALKAHFILHLQNNPFICKVPGCGVRTDAQSHLDRHMRIHTGEQSVVCPKCGLSYSRKDKLLTHICGVEPSRVKQYEDGSKRACHSRLRLKRCKKSEISGDSIVKEEAKSQEIEGSVVAKYQKPDRPNITKIMLSDPVFIKACEENPGFKKLMIGSVRPHTKSPKARRTFRCLKCHIFFNVVQALHKHRAICTDTKEKNWECYQQNGTDTETFNFNDIKVKLGCRICGDSFDTSTLLNQHIENDHDLKEVFKCDECGEVFGSENARTTHLKLKHLEQDLPFACSICNRKYKEERSLAQHMEKHVNGNISIYSCPECGKELSCLESVRRHCLSFHGVRIPYKNEATLNKKVPFAKSRSDRRHVRKRVKYALENDKTEVSNGHVERNISRIGDPIRIKVEPDLNIEWDTDNVTVEYAMTESAKIKVEDITPIIKTELERYPNTNDNILL